MKMLEVGKTGVQASAVVLGCMRMKEKSDEGAAAAIRAAVDAGVTMFDHADIYGGGDSERIFARALPRAGVRREEILLQSKCGIRHGWYDFSKEHILRSVEGILERLGTDHLDFLLLHRPDALVEPEEVAEAFDALQTSGKVLHFGVSNHDPMQMELLKTCVRQPLAANQLQFSPAHTGMVDCGIHVNMEAPAAVNRDGMVLDYCRVKDITVQTWSPFQHGQIEGPFFDDPAYAPLTECIRRMAKEKGVADSAIVAAWILRHPAKMQMITGSMNPQHIAEVCAGADITLTREEWYEIYRAGGNTVP